MASQVPDEESVQIKALNLCWNTHYVGLRGFSDPESAHPRWNGFNRSVDQAGLRGAALKGTTMCRWSHGPISSGSNKMTGEDALRLRLRDCASDKWLEARSERICKDRRFFNLQAEPADDPEEQLAEWYEFLDNAQLGFASWMC